MKNHKGYFIAFEGIDGCGKSSAFEFVNEHLIESGFKCFATHEPRRESPWGRKIYKILHGKLPMVSPLELQRIYVDDRYDHIINEIKPALIDGKIVLADRYWLSTLAFGMLEVPLEKLISLHDEIFHGDFLKPDLTFIFDLPAEIAMERLKNLGKGVDHFEKLEKQKKVRENYLILAGEHKENIRIIDASIPKETAAEQVFSILRTVLQF